VGRGFSSRPTVGERSEAFPWERRRLGGTEVVKAVSDANWAHFVQNLQNSHREPARTLPGRQPLNSLFSPDALEILFGRNASEVQPGIMPFSVDQKNLQTDLMKRRI
jgi:hypothetical protein